MKVTHAFHKYFFGFHVGYYHLKGNGKYLDLFLPFYHVTISWNAYNE